MRIYFGRIPDDVDVFMIDGYFPKVMKANNYNIDTAVTCLVTHLEAEEKAVSYSCNPLIFNFMDDEFAKEHVYIIDENGKHIKFGDDASMLRKLTCMGVGEVVCDDARSFD